MENDGKPNDEFMKLIQPEFDALRDVATALAGKLKDTGDEWHFTHGVNFAFYAVMQGFGLVASITGWIEARDDERKSTVHGCGAIGPKFVSSEFAQRYGGSLFQLHQQLGQEPYKMLAILEKMLPKTGPLIMGQAIFGVRCPGCNNILRRLDDDSVECDANGSCEYHGRRFATPAVPLKLLPLEEKNE